MEKHDCFKWFPGFLRFSEHLSWFNAGSCRVTQIHTGGLQIIGAEPECFGLLDQTPDVSPERFARPAFQRLRALSPHGPTHRGNFEDVHDRPKHVAVAGYSAKARLDHVGSDRSKLWAMALIKSARRSAQRPRGRRPAPPLS